MHQPSPKGYSDSGMKRRPEAGGEETRSKNKPKDTFRKSVEEGVNGENVENSIDGVGIPVSDTDDVASFNFDKLCLRALIGYLNKDAESSNMTVKKLLDRLRLQIDKDERFDIEVVRGKVVDCFLKATHRKDFLPTKLMSVVFIDEKNIAERADYRAGPRREMWTLLLREIEEKFFEGPATRKNLLLNVEYLNEELYFEVGRCIALCLVQEGLGPGFFAPFLFHSIANLPPILPDIDDIGDAEVREKILEISAADEVSKIRVALHKCSDLLGFCGLPPYVPELSYKRELIDNLISFYVVDRKQSAVEQLKRGLETLGVLEHVKKWPELFRDVMCYGDETVNALYMKALFRIVRRGERGNNFAETESRVLRHWRKFLDDCEGKFDCRCRFTRFFLFSFYLFIHFFL